MISRHHIWGPVAALVCIVLSCPPANAFESDWRINQKQMLYGQVSVYIAKNGVRVVCKGSDYSFSCCAPTWDAILYSEKRKLVNKRTYADWSKNGIRTALSVQVNDDLYTWPLKFVRKTKVNEVDADFYAFPYKYQNGVAANLKLGNVGTYITTSAPNAPKQVEQFLQALFDLPPNQGIPLRFVKIGNTQAYGFGLSYNRKETRHTLLETVEIKKLKTKLPDLALKGFKSTTENEIVVKKGEVDNVFTELMGE